MIKAIAISILVNASFLAFYSAYSKALKKLDFRLLTEIFTLSKGLDFTLVQLNKVIALTAICLVSLAFCPGVTSKERQDLLVCSITHVVAHVVYSAIKYYGSSNIPYITKFFKMPVQLMSSDPKKRGKGIKKFSVIIGVLAELALLTTWMNWITSIAIAGASIIGLSILHFYSMEVD